jgi:hypothetical protein
MNDTQNQAQHLDPAVTITRPDGISDLMWATLREAIDGHWAAHLRSLAGTTDPARRETVALPAPHSCPPWCRVPEHDEDERWHCSGGPGGFWPEVRRGGRKITRPAQGHWDLDLVRPVAEPALPAPDPVITVQLRNARDGIFVVELLNGEAREFAAALIFMADRQMHS